VFLPGKRKGASSLIMVVVMTVVMRVFAVPVSQLSRSQSFTLISDPMRHRSPIWQKMLQIRRSTTWVYRPQSDRSDLEVATFGPKAEGP